MLINKIESYSFLFSDDRDKKPEPRMFIFNPENTAVDVYKPMEYNSEKYTFDKTNMPIFYRGIYYVYGKDLSSIYICKRNFVFEN